MNDLQQIQQVQQAIAALEAQRHILGDAVVDASLVALRKQLAEMEAVQVVEQRKLVTILFADLVGFTALADKMDPEDVRTIQQAYFSAVSAPIKGYGGWIEKYIGDAILAVFGLPQAEENDPDRAILAAMEMQNALDVLNSRLGQTKDRGIFKPLQMRIGINTGLVIVSLSSQDDFNVTGDAVNLASRLQNAAPPGGILISYDTYRHVRGVFDLSPLEPISVKGKTEPLPVYLITGVKKRSFRTRRRGVEGVETRMIGRDTEQQTLQTTYFNVIEEKECAFITLVADPGLGKSRLIYEFENWVDLRPERIKVFHGRARLETQHLPFGLLRDLFAFHLGIQDDDPLTDVMRKFELGFQDDETHLNDETVAMGDYYQPERNTVRLAHFIGHLLGYDFSDSPHLQAAKDDPTQIQERATAYLIEYFKEVSASTPVLILLEDLHWADSASLSIIDRLAKSLSTRPVFFLATTRPALYEHRPHWMEGQDFHLRLDIHPLSKRDSRRLVEEILQKVHDIPEPLRDLIVTNAEGNPFYVEELVKMLVEEGIIIPGEESWQALPERLIDLRVPPTLTGVLQARLESLPEVERSLIQQASVIGRVFWDGAITYLNEVEFHPLDKIEIDEGFKDLRAKEMVYRREHSAFADTQELIFKHAMLREVTYESVLKRFRRQYHRQVAEWLVETTRASGRVEEYTGIIAEHYFQAGEDIIAADWLTRAGERALLQGALHEAVEFFQRALALLAEDEVERRWRALKGLGVVLVMLSQTEAVKENVEQLMVLAHRLNNDSYLAEAYLRRASYLSTHGEDRDAVLAYQSALVSARRVNNQHIESRILAIMAISQVRLGEHQAAQASAESAASIAKETGDSKIIAQVYNNVSVTYTELGDRSKAMYYLNLAMENYQLVGDTPGMGNALTNIGYGYLQLGLVSRALEALQRAMMINIEIGARRETAFSGLNLGLAELRSMQADKALETVRRACEVLAEVGDDFGQAAGLTYQGLAYEASGMPELAVACFQQAVLIHEKLGILSYAADARAGWARCLQASGRLDEAVQQVAMVWRYLSQQHAAGMEFPVWAYLTCAQIFQASGDTERAYASLSQGAALLLDRAGLISDAGWRDSYLNNIPEHRQLLRLWQGSS